MGRILNKILKQKWFRPVMERWYKYDSRIYPIIKNPKSCFDSVYHIKDATWESMEMPEVWQMGKRYAYSMCHNAQDILCVHNATVVQNSDVVLTEHGALWDKYESPMYTYMYVMDSNVTDHDKENVFIRNPKHVVHIEGKCISMLGVFEDIWAHFITQFLPKLYYAEAAGFLDDDITIIMPSYEDKNDMELVDSILAKHPLCKRFIIPRSNGKRYQYICDTLYWIPTASALSNDTIIPILYQNIIPQSVLDILHNVVPSAYKIVSSSQYENIYLVRKGTYRNLTNIDEVEEFFRQRGFQFVDPSKLSLAEKVAIFRNAKLIAGPQSGAWTNVMFCNNAKGLMLTPISWLYDGYLGYISKNRCNILMVPGEEIYYKTSHNPYYIPIENIKAAYEYITQSNNE